MPGLDERKLAARKELARRELERRGVSTDGFKGFGGGKPSGGGASTSFDEKSFPGFLDLTPVGAVKNAVQMGLAKDPAERQAILSRAQRAPELLRTDLAGPITKFASSRLAGVPEVLAKMINPDAAKQIFPEQQTGVGKALGFGADIAGLMTGAVGKLSGVASKLAPKGLKTIAEGAVTGAAISPDNPEDFFSPDKRLEQAKGGAIGGAIGAAAGKSINLFGKAAGFSARKAIDSLIKIDRKSVSYGKDPARGIIKEGIVAKNFDDFERKVAERKAFRFKRVTEKLTSEDNLAKRIDISDDLAPIDEAIVKASESPRSFDTAIKKLNDVRLDLMGAKTDAAGNIISSKNLSEISPLEATKIKRQIADITQFTGKESDDALVNMALKKVYGRIKDKINKVVPGLKEDNERLADLLSADALIKHRATIVRRQNIIDLPSTVLGAGVGAGTGNPFAGFAAAIGTSALRKGLSSTPAKTSSAQLLNLLSKIKLNEGLKKAGRTGGALIGSGN